MTLEPGHKKNGSISVYQYVTAFCPADYLFSLSMIVPSILDSIISIINDSQDSPEYPALAEALLKDNPEWKTIVFDYLNRYSPKVEAFLNVEVLPQAKAVLQSLTTGVFGTLVFIKNLLIGLIISVYLMAGKEAFVTQSKMLVYAWFDTERANSIIRAFRFTHKTLAVFISGKNCG